MQEAFRGIEEKLKRADENIVNLDTEINRFFQDGEYSVLANYDDEALLKAAEYHNARRIPPRFNVLAGEVVHHLRSCLDHVAWQFSSEQYRRDRFWKIEFPVFDKEPVDKDTLSRYKGKVKGITNPAVLALIEALQPYNAPDPLDAPIHIIHDMDVIDKHRELVLCVSSVGFQIPSDLLVRLAPYADKDRSSLPADMETELYHNLKVTSQISFKNFGRRELQPVVPGLKHLKDIIAEIVARFEGLH